MLRNAHKQDRIRNCRFMSRVARSQTTARAIWATCLLLFTAACQGPAIYQNRSAGQLVADKRVTLGEDGYRHAALQGRGSPELMLMLAFSGGGKRSSAFSYGVLRGLREISVKTATGEHRLLDEVDGIGSVSGGTFTSAYYGLYRDRIFTDYERDFLKRDMESYIWGIYLLPWHWAWMFDPRYGTNDAMERIYDDLMFHGATYAELKKLGSPVIWIGATDISYGRVFTFNADNFDLLCSDLDSFPIARAVAASNGLPVLFTPITLENHAKDCGGWRPSWIDRNLRADEDTQNRRRLLTQAANEYLDSSRSPYIHLSDGGIADNLALRGLLNLILSFEDDPEFERAQNFAAIRRILVVVADGQAAQNTSLAREKIVTGIGQIINSVSGSQIDNYNFETLNVMRSKIAELVARVKSIRCAIGSTIDGRRCEDVEGHLLHLSLSEIADETQRTQLQNIATGLTIPDADVDALVAAGEAQIKQSPVVEKIVEAIRPLGDSPRVTSALTH